MDEEEELGGWDKDFLDAAFKAEEILLSTQPPPPAPPTAPPPAPAPASESVELHSRHKIPVRDPFASFSPPRVLSQRVGGFNDAVTDYSAAAVRPISPTRRYDSEKDVEIERLKVRYGLLATTTCLFCIRDLNDCSYE